MKANYKRLNFKLNIYGEGTKSENRFVTLMTPTNLASGIPCKSTAEYVVTVENCKNWSVCDDVKGSGNPYCTYNAVFTVGKLG